MLQSHSERGCRGVGTQQLLKGMQPQNYSSRYLPHSALSPWLKSKPFLADFNAPRLDEAGSLGPLEAQGSVIRHSENASRSKEGCTWFFRVVHASPADTQRLNKKSDTLTSKDVSIQIYQVKRSPTWSMNTTDVRVALKLR